MHGGEDHHYLRQGLSVVRIATSSRVCPPDGHAFFGLLRDAVSRLECELPRHVREEESLIFPSAAERLGTEAVERLQEEHREILAHFFEFALEVASLHASPNERSWARMRTSAVAMEALLNLHLAHEEEALHRALTVG